MKETWSWWLSTPILRAGSIELLITLLMAMMTMKTMMKIMKMITLLISMIPGWQQNHQQSVSVQPLSLRPSHSLYVIVIVVNTTKVTVSIKGDWRELAGWPWENSSGSKRKGKVGFRIYHNKPYMLVFNALPAVLRIYREFTQGGRVRLALLDHISSPSALVFPISKAIIMLRRFFYCQWSTSSILCGS